MRFSPHALFLLQKQILRTRRFPGHENTRCPRGFIYALWNFETGHKSRYLDQVSENVSSFFESSFWYYEVRPKLTASWKRQLNSHSSILPVAFQDGFSPNLPKTFFSTQNASKKGLQRLFWWTLHYVAEPSGFSAALQPF